MLKRLLFESCIYKRELAKPRGCGSGTGSIYFSNMVGQSKISSFFKTENKTRPSKKREHNEVEEDDTLIKRKTQRNTATGSAQDDSACTSASHDGEENTLPTPVSSGLSPEAEQKQRMTQKRAEGEAVQKLELSEKVPTNMGLSWTNALTAQFSKDYFIKLQKFVEEERKSKTVYPSEKDVYSWTQLCGIDEVKVVIIGQDPYHGPNQAHGLCFSVPVGVAIPPSLRNMYKELENDIEGFQKPNHGYLVGWAKQGVLLLNACLTVVQHKANAHQGKGWEKFTDAVIRCINEKHADVVFILWGGYAQKKGGFIDKKRHLVLAGPHPSPLSAHRGFFGCKHFSKANEYLQKKNRKPIDWSHLPSEL